MADNENKEKDTTINLKGLTFEKMLDKVGNKLHLEKGKAFEAKFTAKYKELENAEAIANNIRRELEKMFTDFNEGL